jgi:hypothetical protein
MVEKFNIDDVILGEENLKLALELSKIYKKNNVEHNPFSALDFSDMELIHLSLRFLSAKIEEERPRYLTIRAEELKKELSVEELEQFII